MLQENAAGDVAAALPARIGQDYRSEFDLYTAELQQIVQRHVHTFVAGGRFTIADITAVVAVDFLRPSRIAVPERCRALLAWREGLAARPSLAA